ncbi:MAG: hypothetical protein HYX72_02975 [Acidobacteria bacterium]|nr:hypothetical protein [Acidobacteriota bacterium]
MLTLRKYVRFLTCCVGESFTGEHDRGNEISSDEAAAFLRQMPVSAMPADLTASIRCRIAQERRKPQPVPLSWRCKRLLQPVAVPASVGLLSALLIFGVFIRIFEVPVHAGSGDVPLTLRTAPRLRTTALIEGETGIKCMEVKLLIDQNGRVADYQIIKGNRTPDQVRHLEYLLVFTVFDPATVFGRPTQETVTLAVRDGYIKSLSL